MKGIIEHLLNQFEVKKRGEKEIIVFKENTLEKIKDDFRDLIHGTEFMPDDTRFSMVVELLEKCLEYDFETIEQLEEFEVEIQDTCVSIYNHDLIRWLASHNLRSSYCDEAIELGMLSENRTFIGLIGCGQYLEYSELFSGIKEYIEKYNDPENDYEGNCKHCGSRNFDKLDNDKKECVFECYDCGDMFVI